MSSWRSLRPGFQLITLHRRASVKLFIVGPVSNFTSAGQYQTVAYSHHRCVSLSHLIVDTGVPLFLIRKYCTDPNRQPSRFFRDFEYPDCSTTWTLWHTLSPTSSKRNPRPMDVHFLHIVKLATSTFTHGFASDVLHLKPPRCCL